MYMTKCHSITSSSSSTLLEYDLGESIIYPFVTDVMLNPGDIELSFSDDLTLTGLRHLTLNE